MANGKWVIKPIRVEDLLISVENPRYEQCSSQRDAIATMAREQGEKLANLAEDIVDKGLNPSELPMVAPTEDPKTFVVLEGNRRIAALKLLSSPSLLASMSLSEPLSKRYRALHAVAKGSIPSEVECAVLSLEDAKHWLRLRHTGENQGVGIVPWDGLQTQRFRGSSPALQAVELVGGSAYLDEATKNRLPKIAITNIERILGTPEARNHLGVEVRNGKLILKPKEEEALGRLAIVVSDVAHRHVKVTDLDTKDQRVTYAKQVASRPMPQPVARGASGGKQPQPSIPGPGPALRPIPAERRNLIPRGFKLAISQPRINRIYYELRRLTVDSFVNCCAVTFRVFLELSIDHFAQKRSISLKISAKRKHSQASTSHPKVQEMTLRQKLAAIAQYLESNSVCTKAELRGVRALISNRDHVLSVDSLNAYVHNKDFNPTAADLKTTWDNTQIFIERIWT